MSETDHTSTNAPPFEGQEVENLILCNKKLKELSIDSVIKLPQICVIGDQSAGKSSLIEAISKIRVPRAAGCCTQCPIAINLTAGRLPTSPWHCTVTLEKRYEYDTSHRNKQPSKASPMGPWKPCEPVFTPFKTTKNKAEIVQLITEAQDEILKVMRAENGATSSTIHSSLLKSARFSPNVVRLDISEGSWPNLSFLDLPGVIATTDRQEDRFLVQLVENLVSHYASDENSINILTLPMTNDFANSKALNLIQDLKATARTVAVLTKPDLVPDAESMAIFLQKFLEREKADLELKYRVVMMPPEKSIRDKTPREMEEKFFSQEPWSTMPEKFRARLGVEALRDHLRQVLFRQTQHTLPQNLSKIHLRLAHIDQQLSAMPPPPEIAKLPFVILRLTTEFAQSMQKLFGSHSPSHGYNFHAMYNDLKAEFVLSINRLKPNLEVASDQERQLLNKARSEVRRLKAGRPQRSTAQASNPIQLDSSEDDFNDKVKEESPTNKISRTSKARPLRHQFTLEEIRNLNKKFDTMDITGRAFPEAIVEMIQTCVRDWDKPMNQFLDSVGQLIHKHILGVTRDIFQQCQQMEVYDIVIAFVKRIVHDAIEREQSAAAMVFLKEKEYPCSIDDEFEISKTETHFKEWRAQRNEFRLKLMRVEANAESLSNTGKESKDKKTETDLPTDPYETEIGMCAHVWAYYDDAGHSFVREVCRNIKARLFTDCRETLSKKLEEHLGPRDAEKHQQLAQWMAERPALERHRQELHREKQKLVEGQAYIENALGSKSHHDTEMGDVGENVTKVPETNKVNKHSSRALEVNNVNEKHLKASPSKPKSQPIPSLPASQQTNGNHGDRVVDNYLGGPVLPTTPTKRSSTSQIEPPVSATKKLRTRMSSMELIDD